MAPTEVFDLLNEISETLVQVLKLHPKYVILNLALDR
jgi:hypothetical protein